MHDQANKWGDRNRVLVYASDVERLIKGSVYRSPPDQAGIFSSRWPSLAFHGRMLRMYVRSGRLAAKGMYNGDLWASGSLEVLRLLERVGVRFEMENLDVPFKLHGPCVYIGNHMSTLETFVLPCLLQPACNTTFVVKESLTRFPFFGPVLRSRDPVAVGRKDPREDLKTVLENGRKRLDSGTSVIVFPQTTRSTSFDPSRFNTIGIKLARRAGVFAVPVALKTDAWEKGRFIKDFGPIRPHRAVHISFGQPIEVSGSGKGEHEQVVEYIKGKLKEWGSDNALDAEKP